MKIFENKIIICLGPGGVGKTTSAVAVALKAADLGKKCLVMTIDPSRRLASVLGLSIKDNAEKLILTKKNGGELWGKVIEPEIALKDFVKRNSQDPEQIDKLFKNKLFSQLTSNLKDSQDFTSIESLALAVKNPKYDIIILDTPPIQNLIDFFNAPQNMYNLFNSKFLNILRSGGDSKSLVKRFIGTGAKGVLSILAKVTGKTFVEELINFLKCLESLTIEIKEHSLDIQNLLSSADTAYLLVTEARDAKLSEAEEIIKQLESRNYILKSIIFNRAYPNWFLNKDIDQMEIQSKNIALFKKELKYYQKLNKNLDKFCNKVNGLGSITKMPIFMNINELKDIQTMADYL